MRPFSDRLLAWYDIAGRHDLPWQGSSWYHVWISEIMLQQTQVGTVIPYFTRFIARFPDNTSLAAAPLDEVLHHWSGLGYYARARNLHRAAQIIHIDYQNTFPQAFEAALALPGIGRSTAGAILALSYAQQRAILDGNVKRVLARHCAIDGWPESPTVNKRLWALAESLTPSRRVADYTQAIMDLGATVCTRAAPNCHVCPVHATCVAYREGRVSEFPGRRPRRALPQRHAVLLVLEARDGALLLEKRPPSGIWGGLWSFPELIDNADYHGWCAARGIRTATNFMTLPNVEHTFTHFHLTITPVLGEIAHAADACMDSDRWLWYKNDAPARVGIAKPVAQIISMRQKY